MFKLIKILEEVNSPINGKIQVVRTLEGTRILAGGLSQSGWLVKKVWDTALKKVKKSGNDISQVLILGLGGGSAAELVQKYWPNSKIVGVDVDPLMINLGKKYLSLHEVKNLKIVEADAEKWVKKQQGSFDLILIDIYTGYHTPDKFKTTKFLKTIKDLLSSGGVAVFNHVDSPSRITDKYQLESKLSRVFPVLKSVTPEANIIFLCFKE
ncbi:hypothetical protein CMO96_03500 [Candidatus Woesebacteria bacterium]|nr:hypothetical protein [Candidatus Woesebacteria bacterium]|tara:strand:- start:3332 stop:3961 length:630 start_codon:yes stop_codon:yes gene_type:complete